MGKFDTYQRIVGNDVQNEGNFKGYLYNTHKEITAMTT